MRRLHALLAREGVEPNVRNVVDRLIFQFERSGVEKVQREVLEEMHAYIAAGMSLDDEQGQRLAWKISKLKPAAALQLDLVQSLPASMLFVEPITTALRRIYRDDWDGAAVSELKLVVSKLPRQWKSDELDDFMRWLRV